MNLSSKLKDVEIETILIKALARKKKMINGR